MIPIAAVSSRRERGKRCSGTSETGERRERTFWSLANFKRKLKREKTPASRSYVSAPLLLGARGNAFNPPTGWNIQRTGAVPFLQKKKLYASVRRDNVK